ncbi:hypothetical protein HDU85_005066 [Gaertneriomyces sp. JEL0708]|nr:hypothetical protein HDU85_005066 [Gaertneriomyces sp. JEL0708]
MLYHDLRVAIVDDNPVVRKILVRQLKKHHDITVRDEDVYDNGFALVNALATKRYDLILLDIQMPVMGGMEAASRIREATSKNRLSTPPLARKPSNDALAEFTPPRNIETSISRDDLHVPSTTVRAVSPNPSGSRRARSATVSGTPKVPAWLGGLAGSKSSERSDSSGGAFPTIEELGGRPEAREKELAAKRILQGNRWVPLVAITDNYGTQAQRDVYLAAGYDEVLSKPFSTEHFRNVLAQFFSRTTTGNSRTVPRTLRDMDKSRSYDLLKRDIERDRDGGEKVEVQEDGKVVMILKRSGESTRIIAGTKSHLLSSLLHPTYGVEYRNTFLLTFRHFMSPTDLFVFLELGFDAATRAVKKRTLDILKAWLAYYWVDFRWDEGLLDEVEKFLEDLNRRKQRGDNGSEWNADAEELRHVMAQQRIMFHNQTASEEALDLKFASNLEIFLPPVLIDNLSREEVAQQLALFNSGLFRDIHPVEFLNHIWGKKSPRLERFIKRFDQESYWVAGQILAEKDLGKRKKMLKRWIMVAKECLQCKNYFSVFAIMSGFNLSPVQRLKQTWNALSANAKRAHVELEQFTNVSRNFKAYRDMVANSKPPMVPFLPVFIKDLTFLHDGNPSTLKLPCGTSLINFDKLRSMAQLVNGITELASVEYTWFNFIPEVQDYLTSTQPVTMAKLKEASLAVEPKEVQAS